MKADPLLQESLQPRPVSALKSYRRRRSLAARIALPFALLLAVTMSALGLYISSYIRESYLTILRTNLTAETRLVADGMAASIQENAPDTVINDRAQRYADLMDVRVTIIDPNGRVLGESHTDPHDMENHLDRPEIQRALQNQGSTEIRFSRTLGTQMLYAAAPILVDGRLAGVARLAVSLQSIQANENRLLNTLILAMTGATLLAIFLAFLIARYTVVPLKELTTSVQRFAAGEMEGIHAITRQDEIGQLNQAFQSMAHQLKEQIDNLRTERGKLEAVLGNMTDAIIIIDTQGIVQLINPAALSLFNGTEDQALGKSLIEVVRNHLISELWQKSLLTGEQQITTLETTPYRLFLQAIATPLNEALPGMTLLVIQDLTRVRKLENVRRDFVSNVSHELRTPLASLKALTETLQEGALEDPPAARQFLQRMDTEIDNLTQIVHELLELSRIESGRVPLRLDRVHPCDLASPAVERMQVQVERAGLSLHMDCPDDLPQVRADPSRVEQVLVNLLHNAIKFTRPGGEITVSAYPDQSFVVFSVRDTGIGIDPDALPRIFERFYKTDRSRSGGGTGLGLSIARHLIEAHGGRIWAESMEDQGSTFSFTLPVA